MNNIGRILLLVGVVVLALLVGVLIGRGHHGVQPAAEGNAPAVQITTAAPPPSAPPAPLPAPVQAPPPPAAAPIPRIAPDAQVQEDAAAVGMTTKDQADQGDAAAPAEQPASAPGAGGDSSPQTQAPPNG